MGSSENVDSSVEFFNKKTFIHILQDILDRKVRSSTGNVFKV